MEPEHPQDQAGSGASSSTPGKKKQVGAKSAQPQLPEELDLDLEEQDLLEAALAEPVVTQKAPRKKPAAASAKAKEKGTPKAKCKPKAKPKAKAGHFQKKKSEEECKTSKRKRVRDAAYHSAKNAALRSGLSHGRARLKAAWVATNLNSPGYGGMNQASSILSREGELGF